MKIATLVTLILLSSCSSTPERRSKNIKRSSSAQDPVNLDVEITEVKDIKNSDFVQPKELPFNPAKDYYSELQAGGDRDSIKSETIARLDNGELEKLSGSPNPLSEAAGAIYQRKFEKADEILDKAYILYRKNPGYWNQVGTRYLLEGNEKKALLYYNRALDLKKDYAPPLNNLGVIYLKERRDQKALIAFEQASKANPFSFTPIFNLAQLYLEYGLVDKALSYFNSLMKSNSEDMDVRAGYANALVLKNNLPEALRIFNSIDKKYLSRADVSLNYVVALALTGKKSDAQNVYDKIDYDKAGRLKAYYERVGKFLGAN